MIVISLEMLDDKAVGSLTNEPFDKSDVD